MTDKVQKIRAFLVGIADADGVSTILAKAIEKKILPYIDSLQEEPVSEELEKTHNWKPADGDDLPEIDREVIALLDNGKVVFAHRPPEYWDGKDIDTGKVTRNYPKTYDKGGWNIPNVKYWLDVELPKEIKL